MGVLSGRVGRQYRFVSLAPLSGRILGTIHPGLKPWAKLWSPFRATGLASPLIDMHRSDPFRISRAYSARAEARSASILFRQ